MEGGRHSDSILLQQILGDGVTLQIGPILAGIKTNEVEIAREISDLYDIYPSQGALHLSDFRIELKSPTRFRKWIRHQVQAYVDHLPRFEPMPRKLGLPMLESAMNWCVGTRTMRYLLLHAAVVERGGRAVIMPAASGSGKSTLTAALIAGNWRLLSDEVAMIDFADGSVQPHPRPISLKNESIGLIANRFPQLAIKRRYEGTAKGTVTYIKAPKYAVQNADLPARPCLVIAPQHMPNIGMSCDRIEKAEAFMSLARQSPNYKILLDRGFETLARLVDACDHYTLKYSNLDDAIVKIDELTNNFSGDTEAA